MNYIGNDGITGPLASEKVTFCNWNNNDEGKPSF